jgi:hypothetical protein
MQNAGGGELELAVIRGRAALVNEGGQTPLRAGERAFVRAGAAPSYAYVANSSALDAFDRWSEARRDERLAATAEYLPDEVQPYAASFERYGYWRDEPTYGRVWYPRVAVGWRPYYYGRWVSLRPYGWTWIAHDPWGWPTHHYGRWGISTAGAWFWIPGRHWGAAWVSWAYAPGYVSWCPLGWNNRPLFQINVFNVRRGYDPWRAWTIVPRGHFGRGFVHRNVVQVAQIDHRTRSAFTHRDGAPEIVGRAIPRASAPIRVAGTGRRSSAPLYTNVPQDRGRLQTNGARVRVPDASATDSSGRPSRAIPRDRAVPTRPAVRVDRSASPPLTSGARPDAQGRREAPRAGPSESRGRESAGSARRLETPGARPRAETPRSLPRADEGSSARPGTAVPRYQPAPDRGRTSVPRRMNDAPSPSPRIQSPAYRRPAEVPQSRAPHPSDPRRPSYDPRPSYDARPRAIPRGEPSRPAAPSRMERSGPDRAPTGSIQRSAPQKSAPAPSQPSARPRGGAPSGPPAGARPSGGSGGGGKGQAVPRAGARPRGGGRVR